MTASLKSKRAAAKGHAGSFTWAYNYNHSHFSPTAYTVYVLEIHIEVYII